MRFKNCLLYHLRPVVEARSDICHLQRPRKLQRSVRDSRNVIEQPLGRGSIRSELLIENVAPGKDTTAVVPFPARPKTLMGPASVLVFPQPVPLLLLPVITSVQTACGRLEDANVAQESYSRNVEIGYFNNDRRLYGRPHYGLNAPRAASIHAASSVHTYSRRSGGTLMRAGADAQSVVREERRKRAKTRCLVTIGVLLPAMAGIIGVVAYAVSADNYGRSTLSQRTPNPSANVRHRPPLKDIHGSPSLGAKGYPAENRMDAFETKSASSNVPVKRLPPIRADFDKEPELNSLNPVVHPPTIDAPDDAHVRHRLHQKTRVHQTNTGGDAAPPNRVYFDREQLGEPLRHGDGTPESTYVRRPSQADPPYAQRVQPPASPPPPPPSEAVIFHSVSLASPAINPEQTVPVQLKPHRPPIQVMSPGDLKPPTPMLASKTNQLEHADDEFNRVGLPNGAMREQQITVVDSVTNKAYVIHFLVGDNDRNPDGSIAGFDPTSPTFQQYVRDIIRQQDQQAEQQVVVLPDLAATVSEGPPPASSQTSAASSPTTSTTTTTTTTSTTAAPMTSSTTRTPRRTTTTTESATTTSTTAEPSTTSAKPKPAPTTKTQRGKPSSTSRNSHSRVPPIRPRVHARTQPKSTAPSSTTSTTTTSTTTTTTSTTTQNPESSLEYDEPEEDEEIDDSSEPPTPEGPIKENHLSDPGISQPSPIQSAQPQTPLRRSGGSSDLPKIKNISKVDTPLSAASMLQPAASMEVPSRSPLNGLTVMNPHQQTPHANAGSSPTSTTTTRRPPGPKPIFYSEANRRDTNLSSQNPFRPPAPGDYHSVHRPPVHPPTQRFSASNQHAVFANAPFKPPSPPAFMPLPGTFEHQLMGAESQLGLSGVHVLPDGGLLLPALGPQYPPTIPIPPPTLKPKANRQGPSSKSKSKSKRKKQKKDQRFGIELGGSHDDDDGSGITFSIGGGGGPERKLVRPLSIAKHIFLPFLPRPKVNLNKRVVFGVVLENATKLGHKKNHRSGEPEAVADISLNGHAIHDHS